MGFRPLKQNPSLLPNLQQAKWAINSPVITAVEFKEKAVEPQDSKSKNDEESTKRYMRMLLLIKKSS